MNYKNPLTQRLGRNFFLSLPKTPGVYRFYGQYAGEKEALLYVGKAKNLRSRLNSYRLAKPERVSRKVLWLIWQVRKIEVQRCKSERTALLRENQLLRELKPPYNVLNTFPESYLCFAWENTQSGPCFRLTDDASRQQGRIFGVFKSRAAIRDAYGAFLRLLWMSTHSDSATKRYAIPAPLLKYRPPSPFVLKTQLDRAWARRIDGFFSGRSRALLRRFTELLLEKSAIPPYLYPRIQQDLELLSDFFGHYCAKNRKLCRHFGRETSFIAHDEIDDWLVAFKLAP